MDVILSATILLASAGASGMGVGMGVIGRTRRRRLLVDAGRRWRGPLGRRLALSDASRPWSWSWPVLLAVVVRRVSMAMGLSLGLLVSVGIIVCRLRDGSWGVAELHLQLHLQLQLLHVVGLLRLVRVVVQVVGGDRVRRSL